MARYPYAFLGNANFYMHGHLTVGLASERLCQVNANHLGRKTPIGSFTLPTIVPFMVLPSVPPADRQHATYVHSGH